jgi:hypothetical protein
MNSQDLRTVLESQSLVRAEGWRIDRPPSASPVAREFFDTFPKHWHLQFAADDKACVTLPIEASGVPMLAIPILAVEKFVSGTFSGESGVVLANGHVFIEGQLPDCRRPKEGDILLTPASTFQNSICGNETCSGPHIYTTDECIPWISQNFKHIILSGVRRVDCKDWSEVLGTLASFIFGYAARLSASRRCELAHYSVVELLRELDGKLLHWDGGYMLCSVTLQVKNNLSGEEILNKSLFEFLSKNQESKKKKPSDAVSSLLDAAGRKLSFSGSQFSLLTSKDKDFITARVKMARVRIKTCSLQPEDIAGFSAFKEGIPLSGNTVILFDRNGFSLSYKGDRTISDLVQNYVTPSKMFGFPMNEFYNQPLLVSKQELEEALQFAQNDPLGITKQFLDCLKQSPLVYSHNPGTRDMPLTRQLIGFLAAKMQVFDSPSATDICNLYHLCGKPPYTLRDVLRANVGYMTSSVPDDSSNLEPTFNGIGRALENFGIVKVLQWVGKHNALDKPMPETVS